MRYIKLLLLSLLTSCANLYEDKPIKMSGETNYIKESSESLNTKLKTEYRHKIYEPKNKKWESHVTGTVITDYDHFNGQIKNNAFTTIGLEF